MSVSNQLVDFQFPATASSRKSVSVPPSRELEGLYSGIDYGGMVRLIIDGKKILGYGQLFLSLPYVNAKGRTKRKRILVHTSDGCSKNLAPETLVRCIYEKTGQDYRFVGMLSEHEQYKEPIPNRPSSSPTVVTVKKGNRQVGVNRNPAQMSLWPDSIETAFSANAPCEIEQKCSDARNNDLTLQTTETPNSKSMAKNLRQGDIQAELELISAQRAVGLDPLVTMKTSFVIVNESRASVYRKIKSGLFPSPTKRGQQRFMRLSQLESYNTGAWSPPDETR